MPSPRIVVVKPFALYHRARLWDLDPDPAVLRISVPLGGYNPSNSVEPFLLLLGQSHEFISFELLYVVVVYVLLKCAVDFCLTRNLKTLATNKRALMFVTNELFKTFCFVMT